MNERYRELSVIHTSIEIKRQVQKTSLASSKTAIDPYYIQAFKNKAQELELEIDVFKEGYEKLSKELLTIAKSI